MREIAPEGTKYLYLTLADGLPSDRELGMSLWNRNDFDEHILTNFNDVRAVIIRLPGAEEGNLYYLRWDDNTDLNLLDAKVDQGIFTDDDFKRAVKTEYRRVICFNCKRSWRTLVMPTGDPYLGASGLFETKLQQTAFKTCPNCGKPFTLGVVKIIAEVL